MVWYGMRGSFGDRSVAILFYCYPNAIRSIKVTENMSVNTQAITQVGRSQYDGLGVYRGPHTGVLDRGSPMSHVEVKKWQCPLSLFYALFMSIWNRLMSHV